jgi:hypothetical protein
MTWATTFRSEIHPGKPCGEVPGKLLAAGDFFFLKPVAPDFFLAGVTNPALARLRDRAFHENDNA